MQKEDGHKDDARTWYQTLSFLETVRIEDETEEPTKVFDKTDTGKGVRDEAVGECVTSRKIMPHARMKTRRDMDMCMRKRDQERSQGYSQLDDQFRHSAVRC